MVEEKHKNIRELINDYIGEGGYLEKPTLVFQFSGRSMDMDEAAMILENLKKNLPNSNILVVTNTDVHIFSSQQQSETTELYKIKAKDFDKFKNLITNATK